MESSVAVAILLVLLLIGLVLLLVLIESGKNKKKKSSWGVPTGSLTKSKPEPMKPPATRVEVKSGGSSIYAYSRRIPVRCCPQCDGENPQSRSQCLICGCEMGR